MRTMRMFAVERSVRGRAAAPAGVTRGLLLGAACWASFAQADVYVRQDGATLTLTNVPESDQYSVVLVEPPEPGIPEGRAEAARAAGAAIRPDNAGQAAVAVKLAAQGVGGGSAQGGANGVANGAAVGNGGGIAPILGHLKIAARRHGVPEALLHAVIRVESNFNPRAVSPRGAIGLMQLMPATARWLGVNDAFDPVANIDAGARYLRHLLDEFDHDLHLTIAAYNAGPTTVKRWGGIPRFAETEQYVPRVLGHFMALGGRLPPRTTRRWH